MTQAAHSALDLAFERGALPPFRVADRIVAERLAAARAAKRVP